MSSQLIEFEKYNPFRRPDWRFERVLRMVDRGALVDGRARNYGRSTKRDDQYVRALRQFIIRYRNADTTEQNRLAYENPGLYWAFQARERRDEASTKLGTMIEAHILANQTDEEIAKLLHTIPDTIRWYELLFFNVRDRLEAHDWIVDQVLLPALLRARTEPDQPPHNAPHANDQAQRAMQQDIVDPFFDSTVKFFAYYGGPYVLDFVMTGFRRGNACRGIEDLNDWFTQHFKLGVRHKAAAAVAKMPVTRWNVLELFAVHTQIMSIDKSDDAIGAKQSSLSQGIAAMLKEIPFAIGKKGQEQFKGTLVEQYSTIAAEPRDAELQLLSIGTKPETLDNVEQYSIPEVSSKDDLEVQQHASAK